MSDGCRRRPFPIRFSSFRHAPTTGEHHSVRELIEHSFGLTSVYKHNSTGLVNQGDYVNSGQAVALSGNTGELSTGPHLHFELWSDGNPVDPLEYISFE